LRYVTGRGGSRQLKQVKPDIHGDCPTIQT
jgi:hypothetical protein